MKKAAKKNAAKRAVKKTNNDKALIEKLKTEIKMLKVDNEQYAVQKKKDEHNMKIVAAAEAANLEQLKDIQGRLEGVKAYVTTLEGEGLALLHVLPRIRVDSSAPQPETPTLRSISDKRIAACATPNTETSSSSSSQEASSSTSSLSQPSSSSQDSATG